MDNAEETVEESSGAVLPNPEAIVPNALREVNVFFMGPVVGGYFQPVPDKLHTPPRWKPGNYSLTAGTWPSPNLSADLMDLSTYNGYGIMVMASEWNEEVISRARIIGIMSTMATDVVTKFASEVLQEKESEIATYVSGHSN